MRATIPEGRLSAPRKSAALMAWPGGVRQWLDDLTLLSETSDHLVSDCIGEFSFGNSRHQIPRFRFVGPSGGGDTSSLAFFAGLNSGESEGIEAVSVVLRRLIADPALATGYRLHFYPVCRPAVFAKLDLSSESVGWDLTHHFWSGSTLPEVYYLERELGVHQFHGVVSLRSRRRTGGLAAKIHNSSLVEYLGAPIHAAADAVLPWSPAAGLRVVDLTSRSLVDEDELMPAPFEATLETTQIGERALRVEALVAGILALLDSYRRLQGHQPNL